MNWLLNLASSNNWRPNTSRNGGRCIDSLSSSDNIPFIIVRNTLSLLPKHNIFMSGDLLGFRIINPIDIAVVTLVSNEVANPRSGFYFLTLNTLFLRDMNICLCILCPEEGEGDIIRTSYVQ